ncbi:MAG: protein kinase [Myxococcota bacterium]|nr:protein kinase [Myxococcota bacterium]
MIGPDKRYKPMGLLDEGGMGEVQLGVDSSLDRLVAIKRIKKDVLRHAENVTLRQYFEREAKMIAALQHPNIIQVYDYGCPVDGEAYLVTEFVDGMTLEALSDDLFGIPGTACLAILHTVAEALEYAHERGIIHRDLKPGNIMLSRDSRVFLMDFGLAKRVEHDGLKSMVIGSPSFMSPEQVENRPSDERTDIFAFGLLAYSMATAGTYFPIDSPRAFAEILGGEYPADEKLQTIQDSDVRSIVASCLRFDPSDRPSSMQGVLAHLEKALSARGIYSPSREIKRYTESWLAYMPPPTTITTASQASGDPGSRLLTAHVEDASTLLLESTTIVPSERDPDTSRPSPDIAVERSVNYTASEAATRIETLQLPYQQAPSTSVVQSDLTRSNPPESTRLSMENEPGSALLRNESQRPKIPPRAGLASPRSLAVYDRSVAGEVVRVKDHLTARIDAHTDSTSQWAVLVFMACSQAGVSFEDLAIAGQHVFPGAQGQDRLASVLATLVDIGVVVQSNTGGLSLAPDCTSQRIVDCCLSSQDASGTPRWMISELTRLAALQREQFDYPDASTPLSRALFLAELAGVSNGVVRDLTIRQADLCLEQDKLIDAAEWFGSVYRTHAHDQHWYKSVLGLLELDLAFARYDRIHQRLKIFSGLTDTGSTRWEASLDSTRGWLAFHEGRTPEAIRYLKAASSQADALTAGYAKSRLGCVLGAVGNRLAACELLESVAAQVADLGHIAAEALALVRLGTVYRAWGQLDRAEDMLLQARGTAKAVAANRVIAMAMRERAEVARLREDYTLATEEIEKAIGVAESVRLSGLVLEARLVQARLFCDQNDTDVALAVAARGLAQAVSPRGRFAAELTYIRAMTRSGSFEAAFQKMRVIQGAVLFPYDQAIFWRLAEQLCLILGREKGAHIAFERSNQAFDTLDWSEQRQLLQELSRFMPLHFAIQPTT